jgi:DNA-binding PadR family transcriptional regulator
MKPLSPRDIARHTPLRPQAFGVLAALADGPHPGIDVLDSVNATVPGRRLLGPGTLYRLMRDLRKDGLITRVAAAGVTDERQVHHQLTSLGAAVLRAEVLRLRKTIDLASAIRAASES